MTDARAEDLETPERRRAGGWFVAVPAVTFVLGALLGGLVIGVGGSGSSGDGGAAGPTPGSTPTSSGPATAVVVPDSCLEAAESVRRAVELIRGGVGAIQEFRVQPILDLLDLLDDLEDLDGQARAQATTCTGTRVTDAGEPTQEPTETPTEPTAAPTASATPGG